MPEIIPNYHPIIVHFTIALVVTSLGMLLLGYLFKTKPHLQQECFTVSRWCLWLAALASTLTVMAGFHAYYTVRHDTVSHAVMTVHRNWGITSFIAIWLTAIWSLIRHLKHKAFCWLFALALAITTSLVVITGWYGAELVFRYGLGVKSLPQMETVNHQHTSYNHSSNSAAITDSHHGR